MARNGQKTSPVDTDHGWRPDAPQVGSHEALLASGGRYAELFELQARAYR